MAKSEALVWAASFNFDFTDLTDGKLFYSPWLLAAEALVTKAAVGLGDNILSDCVEHSHRSSWLVKTLKSSTKHEG